MKLKMEGMALFGQHLALQGFQELLALNAPVVPTQVISSVVFARIVQICRKIFWVFTTPEVG